MEAPTVDKVRELAATGDYATMTAIAKVVGVTRERVRQIIRQRDIPWQDYKVLLEWACPGCGKWIRVRRSVFEHEKGWNHMSAHCRACSEEDRAKFCVRGHLRVGNLSVSNTCLRCERERARCVIEVRTCEICGFPLNISRGARGQERMNRSVGRYHYACYNKQRPQRPQKTHCKRGHEFTEGNTYHWKGQRHCRACVEPRRRERRARSGSKEERDDA